MTSVTSVCAAARARSSSPASPPTPATAPKRRNDAVTHNLLKSIDLLRFNDGACE